MAENVVLHIVLVGFHHKKGCQVEFSYPPMVEGDDDSVLPEEWKYLPFLALPDGCHNYVEDSTFFNLPPRPSYKSQTTVFGVSCYRQIATDLLKNKDSDVTRGSVQKSVVVLTQEPVFGLLLVKLKMITQAYFEEKDFSKREILRELYDHINASVSKGVKGVQLGLSPVPMIERFHHKVLMLYKLLLLEKRVLFYATPVNKLVGGIMGLLSLFPDMIESGLQYCTVKNTALEDNKKQVLDIKADIDEEEEDTRTTSSSLWNSASSLTSKIGSLSSVLTSTLNGADDIAVWFKHMDDTDDVDHAKDDDDLSALSFENSRLEMKTDSPAKSSASNVENNKSLIDDGDEVFNKSIIDQPSDDDNLHSPLICNEYGLPLSLFTQAYRCLPYVCLQQYDELASNPSTSEKRGFVAGASNMLFTTQPDLVDALVDVDSGEIVLRDDELKKALHLTAADLRFADHLVANCNRDDDETAMQATNWEGGDEWVRAQFGAYLLAMLAVSLPREGGARDLSDFNESFINAWKCTRHYQRWLRGKHRAIYNLKPAHPFRAQYTMSDVKLRLHHNLQGSEKGRKIEDAMANANQAVVNSGRAVSSALGSARSAFSSWLSDKRAASK